MLVHRHSIRIETLTEYLSVSVLPKQVGTTNGNSFSFFLYSTDTCSSRQSMKSLKEIQDVLNYALVFEYYHSPSSFLQEDE